MEQASIEERVKSLCNDLYKKGTKPSVRMVLSMLPDVRSTSTVHKPFAEWKKELEASQKSLYDKLGFSPEFTQAFMQEITRFGVEAEERYKEMATDANEQRDTALEDLERSEEKLYKQTAVLEQYEKDIKALNTSLAEAKKANEATLKELRQQLDTQTAENKALTKTNESLRTEIAKAELKLESNEEYVAEIKANNAELIEDNKALNRQIADLNKSIASRDSTIEGNGQLIAQLKTTLSNAEKHQAKTDAENEKQAKELTALSKANASLESTIEGNSRLIAQLQETQANTEKHLTASIAENTEKNVEIGVLNSNLKAANDAKNELESKLSEALHQANDYKITIGKQETLIEKYIQNPKQDNKAPKTKS